MPAIRHQLSVKSQNLKQTTQNKSQASVTSQSEGGEVSLKRLFIQPGTEKSDIINDPKDNNMSFSEKVFNFNIKILVNIK